MRKMNDELKYGVLSDKKTIRKCLTIILIVLMMTAGSLVLFVDKAGHEELQDNEDATSSENIKQHGSSWDIMINEVKFDGPGENWAEIYHLIFGPGVPINISDWYFGDLDGAPIVPFVPGETISMDPGDLAVVHFSNGLNETDATGDINGNGYIDLYIGNIFTFEADDQLVLYNPSGGMYDAVSWADQDGLADDPVVGEVPWLGSDVKDDIEFIYNTLDVPGGEASWWIAAPPNAAEDDCVFVGPNPGFGNHLPGDTIGRADDFMMFVFDQNRKDEWMNDPFVATDTIDGGMNAGMETQGQINIVNVVINEVKFDGPGELWVELFNAGEMFMGPNPIGAKVDISTWNVTDLDENTDNGGEAYPQFAISTVKLALGEYAVIHFSSGVNETGDDLATGDTNGNDYWDLYTGMNYTFQGDDQLFLMLPNGYIKDVVCWSDQDGSYLPDAMNDVAFAESENEWAEVDGDFVNEEEDCVWTSGGSLTDAGHFPGQTIGRPSWFFMEWNNRNDWMDWSDITPPGGIDSWMTTQGERNIMNIVINEVRYDGTGEHWVELYYIPWVPGPFTPPLVNISEWSLSDLDETPDNGGFPYPEFATGTVNFAGGEYAIIHFSNGVDETGDSLSIADANGNGYWDLYVGDVYNLQEDDQIAISYDGLICRDAVSWANQNTTAESPGGQEPWLGSDVESDVTYLAVRYLWEEVDGDLTIEEEDCVFVNDTAGHSPGNTLGRDANSNDWLNDRSDWMNSDMTVDGGRDAGITTQGIQNALFIKINEVKFDDPSGKNWVELYNRDFNSMELDISTWTLDNLDFVGGTPPLAPEPVTISLGEYIVIHFENGINETDFIGDFNGNGFTDLYVGAYSFDNDDQIVLNNTLAIIDAVCWSDDSGGWDSDASGSEEEDVATIRDALQWTASDPPLESECVVTTAARGHATGDTIGRSSSSSDFGTNSDWYDGSFTPDGGRNAWIETPGRRNAADIVINEVVFDEPGGDNWAEIYNDYPDTEFEISSWTLTNLDGPNINLANDTVTLSYDEYIVVHFTDGTNETDFLGDLNGNGYTDLYLGSISLSFDADDQLALMFGVNFIDAVCWANGGGWANDVSGSEQDDVNTLDDAVRPQWDASEPASQGNCVYTTNARGHDPGDSIGRDSSSVDTISGGGEEGDWGDVFRASAWRTVDGGEDAGFSTQGYQNYVNIVINEVMFDDPGSNNWVELYNKGPVAVDIQQSTLDDYDPFGSGETFATSSITMDVGDYVVVHFNDLVVTPDETDSTGDTNANGYWDIYVSADPTFTNDDQVVFTSSGNYLLDAVAWSDGQPWDPSDGGNDEWQDVDDIDDFWTQWEVWNSNDAADQYCVNISAARGHSIGDTIGLDKYSTSTTSGRYYNWMVYSASAAGYVTVYGGKDAGVATQGLRNYVTLLINEVNFDDPSGNYWVELYNPSSMGLDINGWTFDDLDIGGALEPIISVAYTVGPNEYIVVHFSNDTADETAADTNGNGYRDFYISTAVVYSFESDDQLVLNDSLSNIKDAVCWANQDGTYSGTDAQADVDFLIDNDEWEWSTPSLETYSVYTSPFYGHLPGYTIGRDKESGDSDQYSDWTDTWPSFFTIYGGRDAGLETLGSQNLVGIVINEVRFDALDGDNWAELYNSGPMTVNIQDWTITDLDGSNVAFANDPISFAPGEYAVVHFSDGTNETDITGGKDSILSNGYWDIYVGSYNFEDDDQLALTTNGMNYKDAVCWANDDGIYDDTDAQDDVSELASKVQWNSWWPFWEWDNVLTGAGSTHDSGETIGRDKFSLDTNNYNDWMEWISGPGWVTTYGGKDAGTETKGGNNFGATISITISIIGNDIRLDWEPSPADDVTGYRIYENGTIDGFDFGSYISTAGTTWTFTNHAVDGFEHYYVVRAVDSGSNLSVNSTIVGKHTQNLESGWNMISLPFEPINSLLPNVLQGISGNYDVVWNYNANDGTWHSSNGDLTNIDHKMGLWIYMKTTDELVTAGRVERATTIQLYEGWNLVGYDYHLGSTPIGDALSALPYNAIQSFDASDLTDKWKHNTTKKTGSWASYNDLNNMQMGNGYWILVDNDCNWIIRNF